MLSMRCLWLVWSLLAWLAAVLCTVGCLLPYWLKGYVYIPAPLLTANRQSNTGPTDHGVWKSDRPMAEPKSVFPTDLGLFRRCGYLAYVTNQTGDSVKHNPIIWQHGCGHYSHIVNVPHAAWHIAFFILVSACAMLFFTTFFLFMLGFALYLLSIRIVYRSCQGLLLSSGILALISCVLYPVGWNENTEIQQACGPEATTFRLGRCHIGWAYVLTCSGGLLSIFASTLPIIFPRYISRSYRNHLPKTVDRSPGGWSNCFTTKSNSWQSSTHGKSLDMFPLSVPSPANSIQTESVTGASTSQKLENMLFVPRAGTHSPAGSSSPAASVLCDQAPTLVKNDLHHRSINSLPFSRRPATTFIPVPSAQSAYPPYMCVYVPQRYSTGALISQHPTMNSTQTHPYPSNQRVSVAVNPDPLIYVAEEEEADGNVETHEHPVSRDQEDKAANDGHKVSPRGGPDSTEPSSNGPCDLNSDSNLPFSQSPRRIYSTTNLLSPTHVDPQFLMVPSVQPSLIPGVRWVCPYQYVPIPAGFAVQHQMPPKVNSELIKRKRSSCIL